MGHYRQGLGKLRSGCVRTLTRHEVARGYVYVSQATELAKYLETSDFDVYVEGRVLKSRKVDVSGRVHIPPSLLKAIGTESRIQITIASRNRIVISLAEA